MAKGHGHAAKLHGQLGHGIASYTMHICIATNSYHYFIIPNNFTLNNIYINFSFNIVWG